jgi:hypothetical protein
MGLFFRKTLAPELRASSATTPSSVHPAGHHLTMDRRTSSAGLTTTASVPEAGCGAVAKKPNAGVTVSSSWRYLS